MATAQTLDRLTHLHARGSLLRNELEAMAAECCTLLGVDPESESIDRDWCDEIVFHGTAPTLVIQRIEANRESTGNL